MVTPNLSEASVLLDGLEVHSLEIMETAARALHSLGPKYVLVKGGHLKGALLRNLREMSGLILSSQPWLAYNIQPIHINPRERPCVVSCPRLPAAVSLPHAS